MSVKNTFLCKHRQDYSYKESKIVVLPVPYDETSTYVKGADKGPAALLNASEKLEMYDFELNTKPNFKIHTLEELKNEKTPEKEMETVYSKVKEIIKDNKFSVMIGGEHSISYGAVKAHKEKYNELSVLQIDAHDDLRDELEGSKYNHGCVMKRIKDLGCSIVQAGIRALNDDCPEKVRADKNVFYAWDMVKDDSWMDLAISKLGKNVYLSFDLDGLDPSIMPSTGTPEPGGLGWYQTLKFLRKVFEQKNIVGFDVVELCPIKGIVAPDFLAAKLTYKMMLYKFSK